MSNPTYQVVAHPKGVRTVVATLPSRSLSGPMSSDSAVQRAMVHARLRGEYMDVEADGRQICVVDGAGEVTGYETEFRYA